MDRIKKYNPDIVGFSLLTRLMRDVKELVRRIKKFKKEIIIVAGGPHAVALPEELINNYNFDIVVLGEGEKTMVNLVKTLDKGASLRNINGIVFKKNNQIIKTNPPKFIENLDELPLPARNMLPMKEYMATNMGRSAWTVPNPSTTIMATRGCPFMCTFCAVHTIHGRRIRERSPKNVVDEIEHLIKEYNIKGIWFNDDSFGINKKWVRELFDELKKRKIKICWSCNTRVNAIDEEFVKLIHENGCKLVSLGIESGSQRVLDNCLKKGIRLEEAEKAFKLISKTDMLGQASFMLGIPGETLEDMEKTIEFAKKVEIDAISISTFVPLPGTELAKYTKKVGGINLDRWEEMDFMSEGVIKTNEFTPQQVRKMQTRMWREFYFRPKYILKQIKRIRNWNSLQLRLKGVIQLVASQAKTLYRKRVPNHY